MRLKLQSCTIDLDRLQITRDTVVDSLTAMESKLLRYLASKGGAVVDQYELLEAVWGYSRHTVSHTVQTTVSRLRAKIEDNPRKPQHLITVKGQGYRLELPVVDDRPDAQLMVGRADDLEAVAGLCRDHPLVAIVGPPGVGKTRLALELRWRLRREGGDPVFVDLADVSDGPGLLEAVGRELGLLIGQDPVDDIGWALSATEQRVLILDNIEHLVDVAAPHLASWAARAQVRIVTTSRRPTGAAGERVHSLGELPRDAAVALFLRCVRQVVPSLDSPDSTLVEEIVDRLGRLPLAIELAAGWGGLLPLAEMHRRVTEDHGLLELAEGDSSTARHGSVKAAIRHSWNLVDPPTQELLVALAVFSGPFTARQAESVCAGQGVLRALAELTRRSWCLPTADGRLRFLPPVSAWLRAQLDGHPDRDAIATRHLDWYETHASDLGILGLPDAQRAIETALELRPAGAARLVIGIGGVLLRLGSPSIGADLLDRVLEQAEPEDPSARAELQLLAATLCQRAGRSRAQDLADRAVVAATEAGDPGLLARALTAVGRIQVDRRQPTAGALLEQAVGHAARAQDDGARALALQALARHHRYQGDRERAADCIARARVIQERLGEREALCETLMIAGNGHLGQGEVEAAAACFEQVLRQEPGPRDAAYAYWYLGQSRLQSGDLEAGIRDLDRSLDAFRRHGLRRQEVAVRIRLADALLHTDRTPECFDCLSHAARVAASIDAPRHQAAVSDAFAVFHMTQLDAQLASLHAEEALRRWRALDEPRHIAMALETVAAAAHYAGRLDDASHAYGELTSRSEALQTLETADRARAWWAACLVEQGKVPAARALAEQLGPATAYRDPRARWAVTLVRCFLDPALPVPFTEDEAEPEDRILLRCLSRWKVGLVQ